MPFFTKHSAPAVPRADFSISPDSLKKQKKIHKFTLKQFRVKNDQNCPNNNSKFSIFRFSRSECAAGGSANVDVQHVEQDARPTYALSTSVPKIHEDRNSSSDISPQTNLCETSEDEECCPCLLEDSYHPDKVHKKHWYTLNRKESCKITCSKNNDQKCQQPDKSFKRSFTPLRRPFLRFLHHNSDNGIHYFFESRDCECYNSTESFKTLFGCNDTICQACETENDCQSIFSAPVVPKSGQMCTSDDYFSTEATLVKLDQTSDFCISFGSVFDSKTQRCSSAIPVLSCEGQNCSSPASFVVTREADQCSSTNNAIANNEQYCLTSVDLILSCGAQECSSIGSSPTVEKEPYSSSVDLVLGCELKECGPICQALDSTSLETGSKSTLFLLGNKLGLCSTNISALSCKEFDRDPKSTMLVNKNDIYCSTVTNSHVKDSQGCNLVLHDTNECAIYNTSLLCHTQNSPTVSVSNKELSYCGDGTHHQSDEHESGEEFEREEVLSSDEGCDLPNTVFPTRSKKSQCTGSSKNRDSSKIHRFTLKQFRVRNKQKCHNSRKNESIFRSSRSKCTDDHSVVVEPRAGKQKTMPTDALSKAVTLIHKDSHAPSDPSPEAFLSETSEAEKCCACLLEDSYHPDKLCKKHWYTISRKQSCKKRLSKKADQECRRPRKHLKESFSQITNVLSRFLHQNSEDRIHYFFENRDFECYRSTENFDNIFGCNETVCQTCDPESNCPSIFSTPLVSIPGKQFFSENSFSIDTTSVMVNKPADCCISLGSAFDCKAQKCPTTVPAFACAGQDCSSPARVVRVRKAQQCSSTNCVIARGKQYCSSFVNLIPSCGAQECSSVSSSSACEKELCSPAVDLVIGCELKECGPICEALDSSSQESELESTLVLFRNGPMLRSSDESPLACKGVNHAPDSFGLVNKNDPCCYTDTNSLVEDRPVDSLGLPNTNVCASTSTFSLCSTPKSCSDTSFSSEELICRKGEICQSDDHESEEFEQESFSSTEQECGSPVSGFLASSGKCSHHIRNLSHHMSKECF